MKSYALLIAAFLLGMFAVSVGLGRAIYAVLMLIGLVVLVVMSAVIWTYSEKRKNEGDEQLDGSIEKKHEVKS